MIEVMNTYGNVLSYTYIYTYIQTYIFIRKFDFMQMNAKWYPFPTTLSPCLPRLYDAGTTSMPFLLRWY